MVDTTAGYLNLTQELEPVAAILTVGDEAEDMEGVVVMAEEEATGSILKGSPSMV